MKDVNRRRTRHANGRQIHAKMLGITQERNGKLRSGTSSHVSSRQRRTSWTMHSLGEALRKRLHTVGRQCDLVIEMRSETAGTL